MKKVWLLVISLALVLAVVGVAGCSSGITASGEGNEGIKVNLNSQQEGVWITGTGKVSVIPDIATLSLGIEAQVESVAAAQSQAAEAMEKVMAALTANGIPEKDIQTQYFNIDRVTRWDNDKQQETIIGYRVTNTVTVKIRDMEKIGATIDAVIMAGGDFTRVNNIGFSVEDPSEYYEEARAKAITDARTKAQQLAELAEVKLGKPIYISESTPYSPVIYRQGMYESNMAVPAAETPISVGEMEISLTVQITYTIND